MLEKIFIGLSGLLIGAGIVWFTCVSGKRTMHVAAAAGDVEQVQQFLSRGVNVNSRDTLGQTALLHAAWWGHEGVANLLIKHGINVNAKSDLGFTALQWAINHGHKRIVRLLLDHGAEVNIVSINEWTPLHEAATLGHDDIYAALVAKGASETAQDRWGKTPVDMKRASHEQMPT